MRTKLQANMNPIITDFCIICNKTVDKLVELNSLSFKYCDDFYYLNKNSKCLTEEEYLIKQILE